MDFDSTILAGLNDAEKDQVRHYAVALEDGGTLDNEQIFAASKKYAQGLLKYRQSLSGGAIADGVLGAKRRQSSMRKAVS